MKFGIGITAGALIACLLTTPTDAFGHGGSFNQWTQKPPVDAQPRPPREQNPTLTRPPVATTPPGVTPPPTFGPPPHTTPPPTGTTPPIGTAPPAPTPNGVTRPPAPMPAPVTPPGGVPAQPPVVTTQPGVPGVPGVPTQPNQPQQPVTSGHQPANSGVTSAPRGQQIRTGGGQAEQEEQIEIEISTDNYWESYWFSGNREQFMPFGETPAERAARMREAYARGETIVDDNAAILALLAEASKDEYWMTRLLAATKIGEVGSPTNRDLLVPLLADRSDLVRAAAHMALGMLGDTDSFEMLKAVISNPAEYTEVRAYALVGLGFMAMIVDQKDEDSTEIRDFIRLVLSTPNLEDEIAVGALSAAEVAQDLASSEFIMAQARHESIEVQSHAYSALGRVGYTPENLDFLLSEIVKDRQSIVNRQSITIALGLYTLIDDERKAIQLVDFLSKRLEKNGPLYERDIFAREMTIVALARFARENQGQQRAATDIIHHYLLNGSIEERGFAALASMIMLGGEKKDEQVVSKFIDTLASKLRGQDESDETVRASCASALGMLVKDQREATVNQARMLLRQRALDDREFTSVRSHSFYAIAYIHQDTNFQSREDDARFIEQVLRNPENENKMEVIWNASIALGLLYEGRDIPTVFADSLLKSESSEIRSAVCVALGVSRNKSSAQVLIDRYHAEEHDFVKQKIVASLGEIGSKFGCSSFSMTARDHNFQRNGTRLSDLY
ncbi:MAG: HEAT repeat domain-containing protein [Planctomycetes bacterium]|nr:HEAT repeat domain-containing protein [Planctomycetota bacterium]